MFQQRLASKHYRLRDSELADGRSASGRRQNDEKQEDLSILKPRFYKHDEAGLERI